MSRSSARLGSSLETLEIEVVEKFARGAEQLGVAGHFTVSDHSNPAALQQRAHDVGTHRTRRGPSSISARVIGCRYAISASVSSNARE